ncbi:2,3-diaminopropionate biosynthesis protein SbnB [Hyphomicrobium sp.]|uniref:2,3-diaminopropionate biosynthesis protein SbnB n=1 Tax=Hyphomicrobium sp. TaxID=82 RepID=UPI0025BF3B76|nr:2,3-diaminopropionate biosynthesis protein SbnB [Hyphomicrobium sp.]MCC7252178.1 2,3-diaminopropionate biosynthesis protein SbnB [Hyphomicrobium sp.]
MATAPTFHVVPGSAVRQAIEGNRSGVFEAVEEAYRLHAAGASVNPDSYFLRFPDKPSARIIALPAHLGGSVQKSGLKWISSFPENRTGNLARASAVQILNDAATGYPIACIEASLISATRTAASAALAAERLSPKPFEGDLCIVGTGVIARTTVEWLLFRNWKLHSIRLHDVDRREAERFQTWLRNENGLSAEFHDSLEGALRGASLIIFTTTALEPYLHDEALLAHAPTVLHLSLRDLSVNVVLAAQNIVDDVNHCLKANTSLHLAEQATGSRDFVHGTLVDVLDKTVEPHAGKARIFSPFGLGVLDLAVSNLVLQAAISSGAALALPDFFSNSVRW